MARFSEGLRVQFNVIQALTSRELMTRFGRQNIGFLWIMAEPLLFAGLVGIVWSYIKAPTNSGINVFAFVLTGYIPLTFLRHSFSQSGNIFVANSALLYHRQVKVLDFIFVRVLIEATGAMMAYIVAGITLSFFGLFPFPFDIGALVLGWAIYIFFVLSVCTILAPLSELSEIVTKLVPISTYLAIPFSGVFNLAAWLPPAMRETLMWSPMVSAMELMRYGAFGPVVTPYYDLPKAVGIPLVCLVFGLILCRRVRRTMTVT
ncbi:MAG: ABC transporter permease [Pseudomonadota bacterium]